MHTVRYEAMLVDGVESLRGCVNHLLPENSISVNQLKADVNSNRFQSQSGGRQPGTIDNTAFIRRGQAGSPARWSRESLHQRD